MNIVFILGLFAAIQNSSGTENIMISVHYLFDEQLPNIPEPHIEDHVSVKVLDDTPLTVQDIADYAEARTAAEEAHIDYGVEMYPDPYRNVNSLYIQNYNKPIYARTHLKSGGEVDFGRWRRDNKHVHIYAYKPTDPIVPTSKPGSRTIQVMYPGIEDGKVYIRGSLYDNIEDRSPVNTIVKTRLQKRIDDYGWNRYPNNKKITKLWYQDGTVFYEEGKISDRITMRVHLAKGSFAKTKPLPLLLFNFDPTKSFPWL